MLCSSNNPEKEKEEVKTAIWTAFHNHLIWLKLNQKYFVQH